MNTVEKKTPPGIRVEQGGARASQYNKAVQ